ncbi:MAG: hypothetical protein ABW168_05610, partial [Sedimenticola sp.]
TDQSNKRIGGFDESVLNAYIDGELESGLMEQIKRDLTADTVASHYVKTVRRFQQVSTAALDEEVSSSWPKDLEETLYALQASHAKQSEIQQAGDSSRRHRPLFFALAAGVAVLSLGFGLGFFSAGYHMQQQMILAQSVREETLLESRRVMNSVLEHKPSGEVVAWKSDNGKIHGQLLPIRTVKLGDKQFCREFQEILIIDGEKEVRRGLSCRQGKEQWDTRMIMADSAKRLF